MASLAFFTETNLFTSASVGAVKGSALVKREVYERIPQPHYLQEYVPHLNLEIGEDIYFCQQAQKAGYEIWCDQELSKEVAHIGIFHFNYNLSVPK